jgi:hypothetical protein
MATMHSSLKSTHLLMWSSPILLVVLVFTLTSSSGHSTRTAVRPTTSVPASTTTVRTTTAKATTTTTPSTPRTTLQPPTAIAPVVSNYVSKTSSTVKSVASAPNVRPSSGVLAGTLSPQLGVVDVPLQGPGTWILATSDPTRQSLSCGPQTVPATNRVEVGANQSCQLEITSTAVGTSIEWQLTPTR